jgi:hypothetical protein
VISNLGYIISNVHFVHHFVTYPKCIASCSKLKCKFDRLFKPSTSGSTRASLNFRRSTYSFKRGRGQAQQTSLRKHFICQCSVKGARIFLPACRQCERHRRAFFVDDRRCTLDVVQKCGSRGQTLHSITASHHTPSPELNARKKFPTRR